MIDAFGTEGYHITLQLETKNIDGEIRKEVNCIHKYDSKREIY